VAGRKLEVTLEDNEGLPATALTKLRKLVESDRVHVVAGVILSNVAYALVPYIEQQGIPTLYPINSADDLTQRRRPRWLVRTGFSAGGNMHPFGEYAAKVLGYRKVVTIGLDYAFGWETVGGFHKAFEDNGGQVIQKLWVPLNVQDYGPYLAQVRKDADAVFVVALGRWTLLFAKQYAESGLKGRVPLIAGGTYNDEHVLPQLGDESLGVVSAHHYSASLETPANQRFRAAFEKAYSRLPSFYSENCYTGARILGEAVRAIGGKVEDRPALPLHSLCGNTRLSCPSPSLTSPNRVILAKASPSLQPCNPCSSNSEFGKPFSRKNIFLLTVALRPGVPIS